MLEKEYVSPLQWLGQKERIKITIWCNIVIPAALQSETNNNTRCRD
jgi:hypothetical protein